MRADHSTPDATKVTGYSPEVEELERQGLMEDAMLLAGQHVQSELERVSMPTGLQETITAAPRPGLMEAN